MNIFSLIIFHIADFITIPPLCIAWYKNKQIKESAPQLNVLKIYLTIATIIAVWIAILWQFKENNLFLYHINIIVRFTMVMLLYRELLKKIPAVGDKPKKRNIFLVLIVLFAVFAVINALFLQPLSINPSNTFIVSAILILISALWYNYDRSHYEPMPLSNTERKVFKFYSLPMFWINSGIIIYVSGSTIVYAISNMLLDPKLIEVALAAWTMHDILNIIFYSFIAIGLYKFTTKPVDRSDVVFYKPHVKPKSFLGRLWQKITS